MPRDQFADYVHFLDVDIPKAEGSLTLDEWQPAGIVEHPAVRTCEPWIDGRALEGAIHEWNTNTQMRPKRDSVFHAIIFEEKEKPGSGAKWVGLNTPGQGTRRRVRGYHRKTWMGPLTQVEVWAVFD